MYVQEITHLLHEAHRKRPTPVHHEHARMPSNRSKAWAMGEREAATHLLQLSMEHRGVHCNEKRVEESSEKERKVELSSVPTTEKKGQGASGDQGVQAEETHGKSHGWADRRGSLARRRQSDVSTRIG